MIGHKGVITRKREPLLHEITRIGDFVRVFRGLSMFYCSLARLWRWN